MTTSSGNLGRGLGDLFEDPSASQPESQPVFASSGRRFTPLFIERILAPDLPGAVPSELVESIRRHGLLCPVVVRPVADRFALIAGADRLRAAMDAGLREVPACVIDVDDTQTESLAQAEAHQHPFLDVGKLKREWKQKLADDAGCDPAELRTRLRDVKRSDPNQLQLPVASPSVMSDDAMLAAVAANHDLSPEEAVARMRTEPTPAPTDDDMLARVAAAHDLAPEEAVARMHTEPTPAPTDDDMLARVAAAHDLAPEEAVARMRTEPMSEPAAPPNRLVPVFSSALATAVMMLLLGWATGLFSEPSMDLSQQTSVEPAPNTVPTEPPTTIPPESEPAPEPTPVIEPDPEPEPVLPPPGPDWSWLESVAVEGVAVVPSRSTPTVRFESGVFAYLNHITTEAQETLRSLGEQLRAGPDDVLVVVTGHTDDDPVSPGGLYRDNRAIGMARAVAVVDFLVSQAGLPAHRVLAASNGELNPPYANDTPEQKQKNRTVTLRLVTQPQSER